jgi:integrase
MLSVLVSLLTAGRRTIRTRSALQLEILALRHQLQVLERSRPRRVRLTICDRVLWPLPARVWREWRSVLVIVKPDTVIAWHRRGFRLFWTWKSRHRLGRPAEVDLAGGVIRLSPRRSKTRTGRVLPISAPLRGVLERRQRRRLSGDAQVFRRDGVPVRQWRTALRDACRKAHVPHRLLHDCRRTAARNLIRAGVPEGIAMLLTGHKTRAVFDRYNIVNEQELLTAGERLAAYVATQGVARVTTRGRGSVSPAK